MLLREGHFAIFVYLYLCNKTLNCRTKAATLLFLLQIGGLGGFMQTFISEVLANVRATVAGLGGNGLVAYRMTQCVLMCNPHKNQVKTTQ